MIKLKAAQGKILIRKNKNISGEYLGIDGERYSILTASEVFAPDNMQSSWEEADSLVDYLLNNNLTESRIDEKKDPIPELPLTLEQSKKIKLNNVHVLFENKRDAVVWAQISSGTYGYDTKNEDIVNFMAAKMAAEDNGSSVYRVWLKKGTEDKGMISMTPEDFKRVFEVARDSQINAYKWFETVKTQIEACNSIEEVEKINTGI